MTLAMDRPFSLDDDILADKKRLESFRLGGGAPQFNTVPKKRLSHARSHSRNGSVSLSISAPAPAHASMSAPVNAASEPYHHTTNSSVSTSRSSHHRRRSSVSTRRESAEMMGVALPDLPPANIEHNINLGDKDSVRRRALWALEGKPGADKPSTVEIPELSAPEIERRIFELPSRSTLASGSGFSTGLSGLAGKRDSFGNHLAPSASTKDQLHTLVEEEEEEEEEGDVTQHLSMAPSSEVDQDTAVISTPGRPRPTGLNLRPLSLTPDSVAFNPDFPSPALPGALRYPPGLKALTLTSSPSTTLANKRQSFIGSPPLELSRRSSLSYRTDSMSSCSSDDMPRKRSSITYKPQLAISNIYGLPTPGATPTSERRKSVDSEIDQAFLGHSSGDQSFLVQSHAVLLARVTDLERALKSRSRPQSLQSETACADSSDELLALVADLKAERDELKNDCSGWRTRVASLEKQTSIFAERVDLERREAWIARERVGLLEVEKRALVKQAEEFKDAVDALQLRVDSLTEELATSQVALAARQADLQRGEEAIEEVERLRKALSDERQRRELLERELEGAGLLNTPTPAPSYAPRVQQPRWQSFGSESSTTDVESIDGFATKGLGLNAVVEEDEDEFSDEENGLEGYEDEHDGDFDDATSDSSTDSVHDLPRDTSHLVSQPLPTHSRSSSLVRTWAFPSKSAPAPIPTRSEEVDRFFGCLEDLEDSPPLDYAPASRTGNPFCSPPLEDEDDLPPFVIPADVGVEVFDPLTAKLDKIAEEDEEQVEEGDSYDSTDDEFVGEVDEGGIKFMFTIPPEFAVPESPISQSPSPSPDSSIIATPPPKTATVAVMEEDDAVSPFPVSSRAVMETPSKAPHRASPASPSSIPRAITFRKYSSPSSTASSPSPSKISFTRPSLIPQPVRSAKPYLVAQPRRPSAQQQPARVSNPVSTQPHEDAPSPTSRPPMMSAALQSFANFVPRMPWASATRDVGSGLIDTSSTDSIHTNSSPSPSGFMTLFSGNGNNGKGLKPRFVPKERQLERLRARMKAEQRSGYAVYDTCKRCGGEEIVL